MTDPCEEMPLIGYLSGKILGREEQTILLDVSGVGYEVFLGDVAAFGPGAIGEPLAVYIHTYVREDQIALFGFRDQVAKRLFHILIGINGVGPKLAMALLARLSPAELVSAVTMSEVRVLRSVPGVGKKVADRLILELKDKLGDLMREALVLDTKSHKDLAVWSDLNEALSGLGFSDQDIRNVIKSMKSEQDGTTPDINQLLKTALQKIKNC